jgi:hypothetical protein
VVIKFSGRRKRKIAAAFEEIRETYSLKAYAILKSSNNKIIPKSDNWMPDPAELMKLFKANSVNIQGFDYDVVFKDEERGIAVAKKENIVVFKDEERGIAVAKKENIGTLVGIEIEEEILVTWSPHGTEVNDAVNASVSFANKILR